MAVRQSTYGNRRFETVFKALLREVGVITSKDRAVALLERLDDEEFSEWSKAGTLPHELRPTSKSMAEAYLAAFLASTGEASRRREERKQRQEAERLAAERKRQEETRLAAEAAARNVEAERQRKAEAEAARRAEHEAAQRKQKENLDQFVDRLKAAGIDASVVRHVSVKGDTATITVSNAWHLSPYQIRLQAAQNLWKLWASIASPNDPDKARIKLVDLNDNEVGGSRILGGSLIWVQDK